MTLYANPAFAKPAHLARNGWDDCAAIVAYLPKGTATLTISVLIIF